MHICFLYLSSPVDGHWDYFSVLATVINATVNIEVHVSSILAIIYPRAGLLDHIVVLFLISWEVAISVFKRLYHFIFLPNMYMDSSFFTFFPTCIIFWVFDNVFLWLGWMRMYTLHLVNVRYLFCTVTVLFFFFLTLLADIMWKDLNFVEFPIGNLTEFPTFWIWLKAFLWYYKIHLSISVFSVNY